MAVVLVVLLVALGADLAVLAYRPDYVDLALPAATGSGGPPETWLLVGTDSRQDLPDGPARYGAPEDVSGQRADVVLLLQPGSQGTRILGLPRDLMLVGADGTVDRLAASYLRGPQATVDLLCTGLGVRATHLVVVDMAQFARLVDALGGVDVEVAEPVRDARAGLDLPGGTQHLSGVDALALVRSRHPEVLRDGVWTALPASEGARRRSEFSASVMRSLLEALARQVRDPLRAHALAHDVAGDLTLDAGTSVWDLVSLARSTATAGREGALSSVTVPAPDLEGAFVAPPTPQTFEALAAYGYTRGTCTPAS